MNQRGQPRPPIRPTPVFVIRYRCRYNGGMTSALRDPVTGEQIAVDPNRPCTPVDSPGQALEAHAQFRAWLRGPHGTVDIGQEPRSHARAIRQSLIESIADHADTVYVSPAMSRLAAQLAEANGDHIPVIHDTDIPSSCGLMLFGEPASLGPVEEIEDDGARWADYCLTRGFLWATVPPGGDLNFVTGAKFDIQGAEDSPTDAVVNHGGVILIELYDAGTMCVSPGVWEQHGRPPVMVGATCGLPFQVETNWKRWGNGDTATNGPKVQRLFATVLRLMWQRVAPADEWTPGRSQARRWQRNHPTGRPARVVHLRRYEPVEPSAAGQPASPGRTLDHMVTVRGHWRDQWYRSLGPAYVGGVRNEGSHRRIWIDSHARGQGELVVKPAVTAITR